jgi:hypothetical protein
MHYKVKAAVHIIIYIALIQLFSCDKSFEPLKHYAFITDYILADGFGNNDGFTSLEEIAFLDSFFTSNNVAWAVGASPEVKISNEGVLENYEVGAQKVIDAIQKWKLLGPFKSEDDLREGARDEIWPRSIVGIYMIHHREFYEIEKVFIVLASRLYDGDWIELKII